MTKKAYSSGLQFPDCWEVGDTIHVSGQVSVSEGGNVIGIGDIELQTRTTFENLQRVLKQVDCGIEDLVKINTYVVCHGTDAEFAEFWKKMDRARRDYIGDPGPAATAVRVAGLAHPDLLIEVDGIAAKN
jgi:enamine deaminase RidA (YjgF/YER057c/UK114 family)